MKAGIIGFGSIGHQLLPALQASVPGVQLTYFDDHAHAKGLADALPFEAYREERFRDHDFYLGLGYLHLQRKLEILDWLIANGRRVPPLVHPFTCVDPSAQLGPGTIVLPASVVGQDVRVGGGTFIGNGGILSHEAELGRGCFLAAGVTVSGRMKMGERVFLASGAVIANGITIGSDVWIGLATAVYSDLADGATALGNPMRLVPRTFFKLK